VLRFCVKVDKITSNIYKDVKCNFKDYIKQIYYKELTKHRGSL